MTFWLKVLFKFYIYCFIGWVIESSVVSFKSKKFVNRGFLRLPLLPIYGNGAMIILGSTYTFQNSNPVIVFIVGMAASTILEYVTAVVMENLFKTKYWDYSNESLNFQGRICAEASLFWGFLTLLMMYVIDPFVVKIVSLFKIELIVISDSLISILYIIDTIYSFKSALNFRKVLEGVTKLKNEAGEIRDKIDILQKESMEDFSDKIAELRVNLNEISYKISLKYKEIDFWTRWMIKQNPKLTSKPFETALIEFKNKLINKEK